MCSQTPSSDAMGGQTSDAQLLSHGLVNLFFSCQHRSYILVREREERTPFLLE